MSDEELEKIAKGNANPFSSMSDEELERIANPPSELESGLGGAIQGGTLGFIDELSGGAEALGRAVGVKGLGGEFKDVGLTSPDLDLKKNYIEGRDKKRALHKALKESNPSSYLAGEIGGGVLASLPGAGLAAKGVRGAGTLGGAYGAASGLGASEKEDLGGMAVDSATGAVIGGVTGAGTAALLDKASKVASKLAQSKAAKDLGKALNYSKKENAPEIEAAAKALGFEATPGMTHVDESLQKMESSLHQAPTLGGWLTRKTTKPVAKGMSEATDDLIADAATVSPFESGEKIKKILGQEIEKKFKPSTDVFQDLAQYTKDIPSTEKSTRAVARNIMAIPEVDTLELPLAKQVVRQLEKNPSVDQIKTLRTMVGKKAASAVDGAEASAYWKIYGKLGKLEENTLKRGVIQSARTKAEGDTIAKGMLGQLKSAKQGYAEQMTNLEDLAQAARLGKVKSPSSFSERIDAIPSERLQEKLLPLDDVRLAKTVQSQFPEASGVLKSARLRDLAEGVVRDGESIPGKLLQNTKGLNPEAKGMLFGDKASKLDALRTVNQALPEKVGPSGTQQAFDAAGMMNIKNQVRDLYRYAGYRAMSSDRLQKVSQFLLSKPQFRSLAERNPKAFQAAVYQFSERARPQFPSLPKVAGEEQAPQYGGNEYIDENEAKQRFLEGN